MMTPGSRLIWPPSGRICRSSSLVSQAVADLMWRAWPAMHKSGIGRARSRLAGASRRGERRRGVAQMPDLPQQAAQEAAIKAGVGILQQSASIG